MSKLSATTFSVPVLILGCLSCIIFIVGCGNNEPRPTAGPEAPQAAFYVDRNLTAESIQQIEAFCGDCHAVPRASSFPLANWQKEVERGFEFYDLTRRNDLVRPNLYDTIAYFTKNAPTEDDFFSATATQQSNRLPEEHFRLESASEVSSKYGISNIQFATLQLKNEDGVSEAVSGWITCDMTSGNVRFHPVTRPAESVLLTQALSPANATVFDVDQDGDADILISDIGEYKAMDALKGQVILLRANQGEFERIVIKDKLGRICQTAVADFNGDGQLDVLVAEFGYFQTGGVYLLRNLNNRWNENSFVTQTIDHRHGVVRLVVTDFNHDGAMDFAAAFAQEHETVEVFLNNGNGEFTRNKIFEAGYPSYGSSGISLSDLDQDGDLDILYTNGDTFDSSLPKQYHSIQWLENQSTNPADKLHFVHHPIGLMPGVHCAKAGDFDKDGDLDIVASAFMAPIDNGIEYDAVIYLENNGHQEFKKYSIDSGPLLYPNLHEGDFNQDSHIDFVVGSVSMFNNAKKQPPLKIFWNRGVTKP